MFLFNGAKRCHVKVGPVFLRVSTCYYLILTIFLDSVENIKITSNAFLFSVDNHLCRAPFPLIVF